MDRLYQDNSDSQRYFVMFLFYFADYNKDMVTFRKFLVSLYQRSNIEWQPIQCFVLFYFIDFYKRTYGQFRKSHNLKDYLR
jgi:hypothetical protein